MGTKSDLVYVGRHGTTDANKSDTFRGQENFPLDQAGFRDAQRLGLYLRDKEFCFCFCSDRKRSIDTAEIVCKANKCGLVPQPNRGLRPWDIGYLTGEPKDQHLEEMQFFIANPSAPIKNGESLNAFRTRVRPLIKEAVEISLGNGKSVLLIGHSSIIHEIGTAVNGHPKSALVQPGGCALIHLRNGELVASPIFRPGDDDSTFSVTPS